MTVQLAGHWLAQRYKEWVLSLPADFRLKWKRAMPTTTQLAEASRQLTWPPDPRQLDHILFAAADGELNLTEMSDVLTPESDPALVEQIFRDNTLMCLDVAFGHAPVIMLSAAQQMALWFTEPSGEPIEEGSFDDGVFVCFHDPILFGEWDADDPIMNGESGSCSMLGVYVPARNSDTIGVLCRTDTSGIVFSYTGLTLDTDWEKYGPHAAESMREAWRFALVLREAAYTFGLKTEPTSTERVARPERRRRDRAYGKRKPSNVSVRYLRDHSEGWHFDEAREKTGRTVAPHLRMGHFRNVRTGSMSMPKEERPTVRRHVKACIVNGHLGMPAKLVAYYDRTRSHRSKIASSSSDHSSDEE